MNETPGTDPSTALHPPLMGLAKLMTQAFVGQDLGPLGAELLARANNNAADANALMDLSIILQLRGDPESGFAVQAQALAQQQLYRLPAVKPGGPRLLAIKGPGELMWNTPLEFLVQDSDIALDMLYLSPDLALPPSVPEHDVLMIAVAQLDKNRALLASLSTLTQDWPRPVVNRPDRIAQLTRDNVCRLLAGVPGLLMPLSVRCDRTTLERVLEGALPIPTILADGDFPIIIRPIDSHAGRGLAKIADCSGLADYLRQSAENTFYISRFIDYRHRDGLYSKCRVVVIDGQPFAAHQAISEHWMIHYLNAGMAESVDKRAQEAHFMATFETGFAAHHQPVLDEVTQRLGLDYYAIDCAQTADGDLLIFEVDSAMVVHAMDPAEQFSYKKVQMRRVSEAFRALLVKRQQRAAIDAGV